MNPEYREGELNISFTLSTCSSFTTNHSVEAGSDSGLEQLLAELSVCVEQSQTIK